MSHSVFTAPPGNHKWCQWCTKQKREWDVDGFHPKVPLDLMTETRRRIVEFLEMVEQKMAAASLYDDVLHDSENISWIGILPTRRNGRVQKSPANNVENSFNCKVKEDQGALPTVLDLAKAVEQVSLPFVWAWTTHFSFPRKCCVCCVAISKQRRIQFERCVAEPSKPFEDIL